ncbi:double-strand break repair protein AddB [Marinicauda salina]|uniref:Double-strand break repair protein AddB n=1 Tax=Marinicauda salina TaxID=2135793 RepID=A0A2U2BWX0_9PROT|nr:double-strand break repair protein AddB [Marinicauda salina]PWE18464.1 double-strand break repair protein AddB [Marinicauda salina]
MSADPIFSAPAPRVFTLPASVSFLDSLAGELRARFPEPDALADVTILAPTRRAGRALAEAFTRADGGAGAALLPMIRPIGDVDADDPPFEPGELADAAPPAISAARRRFELASLILKKERAAERAMAPDGALALADELAALIDDAATEEVEDFAAIDEAIRAALPAHMQEAAIFLEIVTEAWPARLAELGAVDPARRRSLLLRALAERWREQPPDGPVIAAGSTASIPAAAELLRVVANLPQGAVVLPGFQPDMDERAWAAIDDTHPQRSMKAFVESLDIDRTVVRVWPGGEEGRAPRARGLVLAEALRPAEATSDWLGRVGTLKEAWGADVFETALDGLSVIEAGSPEEEGRAIALALRETLETPDREAILVTPDRALARRVATEMRRFGVTLDDSAGEALSDTAAGVFLFRVLDAALDAGSALALSALVASPLFALGGDRAKRRAEFGAIERRALRGRKPGRDYDAVRRRIDEATQNSPKRRDRWRGLIDAVEVALAPLLALEGPHPAEDWARALAAAGEALAADSERSGAERLWAGDAGEAAAGLVREFIEEAGALPPMTGEAFARALLETARARRVRPRYGGHPRLQILGPLEARLVGADRVILAGLNEGVWPAKAKIDPFMSRGMRAAVGLSAPERRFGLAAHDFAQLAAGGDVILSRSVKQDSAPAVASRWLWRLQTLARGALGEDAAEARLTPATDYLGAARRLDAPGARRLITRGPQPCPPVEARPRRLSVTRIETWVRDPYAIYARYVLGLDVLDPLDRPPGPAERGQAYHAAFERWIKDLPDTDDLPRDAHERLAILGRDALLEAGFSPDDLGIELPRFARAAAFLAEWEATRRRMGWRPVAIEATGELTLDAPGGAFTLRARADRIDIRPDGALDIVDYKTGTGLPSVKEVAAGFAPQLPLEAAMAARGAFPDCPPHEAAELIYLSLSGGKTPGFERLVSKGADGMARAEAAFERLAEWIATFDDPARSYPSQPRAKYTNTWGDYDHLARRKEWASAPGETGEGGGGS